MHRPYSKIISYFPWPFHKIILNTLISAISLQAWKLNCCLYIEVSCTLYISTFQNCFVVKQWRKKLFYILIFLWAPPGPGPFGQIFQDTWTISFLNSQLGLIVTPRWVVVHFSFNSRDVICNRLIVYVCTARNCMIKRPCELDTIYRH